ncbi:MAG: hypothetical protein JXO49_01175 [Deltaproteobacteria bacterium]|nr:hypothetical protein [Candidatus Anaeroferrophillus wilburensis]MBN2887938.1 hypothetical protein [Deltaproteobacteria bacterium]
MKKIIASLLMILCFCGCQFGGSVDLPPDLLGTWGTESPKYADRFLTLETDVISFGIGGGEVNRYAITQVKAKEQGNHVTDYIIHYKNEDNDGFIFAFTYDTAHHGNLIIRNQPGIWTRVPDAPSLREHD